MSLDYALNVASSVSGLLPVAAALYNYKHLDKVLRIAAIFFLVSSLFDWVLELTKATIKNNLPAIHVFIAISAIFYGAIYYNAFFKPFLKKAVVALSVLALLIIVYNVIFIEGIWDFPSLSTTVLSVLLICFSLAYFYQIFNRQEFIHIEKQGLFWINAGVLFYFSINIFLFMLLRTIIATHQEDYFMIHIITNIIANILFAIGLLCKPQKTT